jgi:hypothetical protein
MMIQILILILFLVILIQVEIGQEISQVFLKQIIYGCITMDLAEVMKIVLRTIQQVVGVIEIIYLEIGVLMEVFL